MRSVHGAALNHSPQYFSTRLETATSLAPLLEATRSVDESALRAWLVRWGGWSRLFSGFDVVKPHETVVANAASVIRRQDIPTPQSDMWATYDAAVASEQLWEHLRAAVHRSIAGARRVAVAVGGTDSSAILTAVTEWLPPDAVRAVTLPAADEPDADADLPYVEALCAHLRVPLVVLPWKTHAIVDSLFVDDRPSSSPYVVAEREMAAWAAAEGCDVLLSGAAGDMVFGGALEELGWRLGSNAGDVVRAVRTHVPWSAGLRARLDWITSVHRPRRRRRHPRWMGPALRETWERQSDGVARSPRDRMHEWFTSDVVLAVAHHNHLASHDIPIRHSDPTLDDELLRFLATIPIETLNCDRRFRGLLHRALEGRVPACVAARRTKSYVDPFRRLPATAMRVFEDLARAPELMRRKLVDANVMSQMLAEGDGFVLWRAFVAEAWLRRFA